MSTPLLERLSAQFTQLIGPEAFAKAAAAAEAGKAAAAEAAKVAAAKAAAAAAAAAAAKATAPAPAGAKPAVTPVAGAAPAGTVPAPVGGALAAPRSAASAPSANASAAAKPVPPATAAPAAPRPAATPATPAAPVPPIPPPPLQTTDFAQKGYHLDATVAPQQVPHAARLLDAQGFSLDAITGVDWLAQNEMEVVYDFFHPLEATRVVVRARIARATPELPTIVDIFPGANWHERETHDFFGIRFNGHPNMKPFLLPEDANFHPLRKDYAP